VENLIDLQKATVDIMDHNAIGHIVEYHVEESFGEQAFFFGLLAFGDVLYCADGTDGALFGVVKSFTAFYHVFDATVCK
jgi:hypothetical protein